MSYVKPPIPPDVMVALNKTNIRQFPRWYPTIGMLRAYEQELRRFTYLDAQDAASTYQYAQALSGGLESGAQRDYGKSVPPLAESKVLYWQEQKCRCKSDGSDKKGGVCKPGNGCTPFYIILQESWQRAWAASNPIRVLFMDETHHVVQVHDIAWSIYRGV